MELKEYQQQAKRTLAQLGDPKLDLCHMVLGIMSETSELAEAIEKKDEVNIKEEIADHFWYIANYCTLRGFDFDETLLNKDLIDPDFYTTDIYYYMSKLQDLVKKNIAYNKPIDRAKEYELLQEISVSLITVLNEIDNTALEDILEQNINKLKVRFPEKFNQEQAINRDLESEYKTLE